MNKVYKLQASFVMIGLSCTAKIFIYVAFTLAVSLYLLPTRGVTYNGVGIAGWNEHILSYREKSLCWHRLWIDADKQRHGALADIMCSTTEASITIK